MWFPSLFLQVDCGRYSENSESLPFQEMISHYPLSIADLQQYLKPAVQMLRQKSVAWCSVPVPISTKRLSLIIKDIWSNLHDGTTAWGVDRLVVLVVPVVYDSSIFSLVTPLCCGRQFMCPYESAHKMSSWNLVSVCPAVVALKQRWECLREWQYTLSWR